MLRLLDRGLALVSVALAVLLVVLLFTGPGPFGSSSGGYGGGTSAGVHSGETLFKSAGCASCHTLKAAGASGTMGPDLDKTKPSAAEVRSVVTSGRGSMPSFSGKLSRSQIASVARYVASVAGH